MQELEYGDIQGIVLRGYRELPEAYFVMLRIPHDDLVQIRLWLARLANDITLADSPSPRGQATQLAITHPGLRLLGLTADTRFSCEFEEGVAAPRRSRVLGDVGDSAPCRWAWGNRTTPVHFMLMLYGSRCQIAGTPNLCERYADCKRDFEAAGLVEVAKLTGRTLPGETEHFGFADGISQPILSGTVRARGPGGDVVAAGEFLLGYKNAYGRWPDSPSIAAALDGRNYLSTLSDGRRDFGRNGSYLVFRQLEQDVVGFWRFVDKTAGNGKNSDPVLRDWIAAKMVGRWRSGTSLMRCPDRDDRNGADNDFLYVNSASSPSDPFGFRCPLGAHVRRTNPRDSVFPGTSHVLSDNEKHRILRRGRPYGKPIADSMKPGDILAAAEADDVRGLHFICLNADIGRQFEFVQQTWVNNPGFAGLYGETDPLIGAREARKDGVHGDNAFTIPRNPVRTRVRGIGRYVQVRGSGYFFLPSISAIRVLAELSDARRAGV